MFPVLSLKGNRLRHRLPIPESLVAAVSYDPITGVMTWAFDGPKRKAGEVAGSLRGSGYWFVVWKKGDLRAAYAVHRVAWVCMTGEQPPDVIDHEDRLPSNNRWKNLRASTTFLNKQNQGEYRNNTSGQTGVYKHPQGWTAVLQKNGKRQYLGFWKTREAAVAARINAERNV